MIGSFVSTLIGLPYNLIKNGHIHQDVFSSNKGHCLIK